MLDQERGHHHPHTVVHHAGVPEFAHAGVDDGISGLPALPRAQCLGVVLPGKRVERCLQIARCEIRNVVEQMTAEFAPAEFAEEFIDIE